MGQRDKEPAGDESEEQAPEEYSLEDRVAHLETIVNAFLTAHGETYNGALKHNETLAGLIAAHH